jgi:hypothetical protein
MEYTFIIQSTEEGLKRSGSNNWRTKAANRMEWRSITGDMKDQYDDDDDNTVPDVDTLWQFRFQCGGVWISTGLPCMYTHFSLYVFSLLEEAKAHPVL